MATIPNQQAPIKPILKDEIEALMKEGSVLEWGILSILSHESIGSTNAVITPSSELHGDVLRVRKNGIQVGANREDVINNAFYSGNRHQIQTINLDKEWWVRFSIDISALNSLWQTFSGQDLKDQLKAILFEGLNLSMVAKLDAVILDLYNKALDTDNTKNNPEVASVVNLSLKKILDSTNPVKDIINALNKVSYKLSQLESKVTTFRIGVNTSSFQALTIPFLGNLLDNYFLRNAGNESGSVSNIRSNASTRTMFGINWRKHPFFNQLVNKRATDFLNITDETIFDATTTYDFSGLLGIINHTETALLPIRFKSLTALQSPTTSNWIVVARISYGVDIVRPSLLIKIKDGGADQETYGKETDAIANSFFDQTNAIVVASGSPIAAALQTSFRSFTGTSTIADYSAATIISTDPINAGTTTTPLSFKYTASIPVKADKDAKLIQFTGIAFYKNA